MDYLQAYFLNYFIFIYDNYCLLFSSWSTNPIYTVWTIQNHLAALWLNRFMVPSFVNATQILHLLESQVNDIKYLILLLSVMGVYFMVSVMLFFSRVKVTILANIVSHSYVWFHHIHPFEHSLWEIHHDLRYSLLRASFPGWKFYHLIFWYWIPACLVFLCLISYLAFTSAFLLKLALGVCVKYWRLLHSFDQVQSNKINSCFISYFY